MEEDIKKTALAVGARKIACAGLSGLLAVAPIAVATTALLGTTSLTPVYAQDRTTGALSGVVADQSGVPAAGVTVTLTDASRGFTATALSGANGNYRFSRLPIATYTVSVISRGEAIEEVIRVQAGSRQGVNFVVSSAEGLETVTVTARRATSTRKDFLGQESGITIDTDDLMARVPVPRNITSVALMAPGTSAGDIAFTGASGGGLPSIAGSSVGENSILVNGFNTTDPRRFLGQMNGVPFEFYQQIDIKTGGFQAEFGRTTGGVINLVTKSGTNEYGGGISFYTEPETFRGHDPDTEERFRSQNRTNNAETNVWLSGPIIKDRLFFYALANFRDNTSITHSNTVRFISKLDDNPRWGINIDGVLWDDENIGRHTFTYTHIDDARVNSVESINNDRDSGVLGDVIGTSLFNAGGNTDIINYKGVIRDWLTVSFMYGNAKSNRASVPDPLDGNPAIFDSRVTAFDQLGNFLTATVRSIDEDAREIYRGDVDIFVDDMFGDHVFRLGFDIENLESAEESNRSGGILFQYFDGGDLGALGIIPVGTDIVSVGQRTTGGSFKTKHSAIYIQDRWSVTDRLTLNIGLRNETFDNKAITGESFAKLSSQFDARLGFTYDLKGDQTSRIYGFAGRFHFPIANNTNVRMAGSETFFNDWFFLNGLNPDDTPILGAFIGQEIVSPGGIQPPTTLVSKTMRAQKQDEFFLGYEFDMEGDWTFGARLIYRNLNTGIEDGAIDRGMQNWADANGLNSASIAATWSAFHQFVLFNPGSDITVDLDVADFSNPDPLVNADLQDALTFLGGDPDGDGLVEITLTADLIQVPKLKRTYKALELTAEKRLSNGWSFTASYTLSRSFGNYEGSVKSDNGQTDSGLTTDFDTRGLTDGITGRLPNDKTHSFKVFGSYEISDNLTIAANLVVQSPRVFGCRGRHPTDFIASLFGASSNFCDLDGDGERELVPRGSVLKSQWTKVMDVSAIMRPDFEIFEGANISFRLDIFNVFNVHQWTDLQENGTFNSGAVRDTFGDPTGFTPPRRVRLSARAAF